MDASNTLYGQIFDLVAKATRFMRPYQGRVLSVDDLERRGRVKCAVEELGWFTPEESPWCEPVYRGGHLCVPIPGDYVMVAFLAGDGARPIWDGLLGEVSGQEPAEHDGPKKRILYSKDGNSIVHDETDNSLTVSGFNGVSLDADNISLRSDGMSLNANDIDMDANAITLNEGINGAARVDDTIGIDPTTDPVNVPMLIAVCAIFGMPLVPPFVGKVTSGSATVKIG